MARARKNVIAVVVETFGSLTSYTLFYESGLKRHFNSPSVELRSRFDFWCERFDSEDVPLIYLASERVVVLTPNDSMLIPEAVYSYLPLLRALQRGGFVL